MTKIPSKRAEDKGRHNSAADIELKCKGGGEQKKAKLIISKGRSKRDYKGRKEMSDWNAQFASKDKEPRNEEKSVRFRPISH